MVPPTSKIIDAVLSVFGSTSSSLQLLAVAILLGHPVPSYAQEDPGRFEVRSATTELKDGVYLLSGWIEFRLSSDTRTALESGVPLTIRLEVEVIRDRRFWFDREEAGLEQAYQLEYHALSERYLVRNLNSGEQTSFATLFSALNHLGRIDELPLIDASLLEPDDRIRRAHARTARHRAAPRTVRVVRVLASRLVVSERLVSDGDCKRLESVCCISPSGFCRLLWLAALVVFARVAQNSGEFSRLRTGCC